MQHPVRARYITGQPVRVLYIAGAGRSGSTLLTRLLGQVDGVFPAGELTHVWERGYALNQLCGCGAPFAECDFWKEVSRAAFPDGLPVATEEVVALRYYFARLWRIPVLRQPRLRSRRFSARYALYSNLVTQLYRAIAEVSSSRVIVDSSKYPAEAFFLQSIANVDLRVLHLVRHSQAVAYSWRKWKVRPEIQSDEQYMPRYSVTKTAIAWNIYNGAIESLRRGNGYQLVRYEDFVENPGQVMETILNRTGLSGNDCSFGRTCELDTQHTVSGNPMRFATGSVTIQADSEWETGLGRWQRLLVGLITAPMLRRYSYR